MGRRDEGLLTCAEVRDRILPLLLRTLSGRERDDIMSHTASCDGCRLVLDAGKGRLQTLVDLGGAEVPPPPPRLKQRPRRRLWLALLPAIPAVIAYALLIQQGIKWARYRYEQRFLARLDKALYLYKEDFGHFPASNGTPLAAVLGTTANGGPYLELDKERRDGIGHFIDYWGNRYIYTYPGQHNPRLFDLHSYGANSRNDGGGGDDIRNWEDGWKKMPVHGTR